MTKTHYKLAIYIISFLITLALTVFFIWYYSSIDLTTIFSTTLNSASYQSLLKYTTPLLLSALAIVLAGRAGLLNIGVEGQIYLAAFLAGIIGNNRNFFYEKFTSTHLITLLFFSLLIPGLLAAFCGWLKSKFKIHEVLSTLFSYLFIVALLNYAINLRWFSEPTFPSMSKPISESLFLPSYFENFSYWPGLISFFVAILLVIGTWILIEKTIYGVRLKGLGYSPVSFSNLGFSPNFHYVTIMFASGAVASVVGILRVCAQDSRYIENFSPGYGFIGLGIAFAAKYGLSDIIIISLGLAQFQCFVAQWKHLSSLPYEFLDLVQVIFIIMIVLIRAIAEKYFDNS